MQVNNNNQTSFGMKYVNTYGASKRIEKLVDRARPDALKIGHGAAKCDINREGRWGKISIRVTFGEPDTTIYGVIKTGWVFTRKGLLKLISRTHARACELLVLTKLPKNPPKEFFGPSSDTVRAFGDTERVYKIRENSFEALEKPPQDLPDKKSN